MVDNLVLTVEDIDGVSSQEYEQAEEKVSEIIDCMNKYEEEISEKLEELNSLAVYEKLDVEIVMNIEHDITHRERNED